MAYKIVSFALLFLTLTNLTAANLRCYFCHGPECNEITGDTPILTCSVGNSISTTQAPTTDGDVILGDIVIKKPVDQQQKVLMLEEQEELERVASVEEEDEKMTVVSSEEWYNEELPRRFSRKLAQVAEDNEFRCIAASYEDSDGQTTLRTCARVESESETEESMCAGHAGRDVDSCRVCSDDLCNSSPAAAGVTSLLLVLCYLIHSYVI